MSDGMTFDLTGDAAMGQLLTRIGEGTGTTFMRNLVLAGGLPVANQAKVNLHTTPSKSLRRAGEPISETGNLACGVHVGGGPGLESPTTGTDIGGLIASPTHAQCRVGTNVDYAARVEYGFIGKDSMGRQYHQAANPYLRPAFITSKDEVRKAILASARTQLRTLSAGATAGRQ